MLTSLLSKLLPGFQFESKLDVGHFLAFVTLLAGFASWAVTSFIAREGAVIKMLEAGHFD